MISNHWGCVKTKILQQRHAIAKGTERLLNFSIRYYAKRLVYLYNVLIKSNVLVTSVTQCLCGISFYTIPFLLLFISLSLSAGKEEKDKNKCEKYIAKGYHDSKELTKKPKLKIRFNLRDYFPIAAKEKGIKTGKTIVQIFLNKKGKLVCTSILKKSEGYGFDEAAIQIIRKAKFRPGEIKGKQVDSIVVLPVEFTLD